MCKLGNCLTPRVKPQLAAVTLNCLVIIRNKISAHLLAWPPWQISESLLASLMSLDERQTLAILPKGV